MVALSLLFLLNNFPFAGSKYDQYHGEQGIGPYQDLIDYVNSKGGLTFWAHPEYWHKTQYPVQFGIEVGMETEEYSQDLLQAKDYRGFAIFYAGYGKIGLPGGIWDFLLKEYCEGKRDSSIWAINESNFIASANDISKYLNNFRTVLLVPQLTRQGALKALKEGKMYVVKGDEKSGLILDKFNIKDSLSDSEGTIADEIVVKGKPAIEIKGHFSYRWDEPIKVRLIRNGAVIKTFEVMNPFEINYQDDYFEVDKKIHYRIEIESADKMLITNPVFVKFYV
jgi:hypothetical protein